MEDIKMQYTRKEECIKWFNKVGIKVLRKT